MPPAGGWPPRKEQARTGSNRDEPLRCRGRRGTDPVQRSRSWGSPPPHPGGCLGAHFWQMRPPDSMKWQSTIILATAMRRQARRNRVNCKRSTGVVRNSMSETSPLRLADSRRPAADSAASARTDVADDTRLAVEIRELVGRGAVDEAHERFALLVANHQRRASRLAFQYLRHRADADQA